jgi:hypothetical protein
MDVPLEVLAVAGAGHTVRAFIENTGAVRNSAVDAAALRAAPPTNNGQFHLCSRSSRTADERADCQSSMRFTLQKGAVTEGAGPKNYESALQLSRFLFERRSDQDGFLNTFSAGRPVRVLVSTPDDLLTRVRLLGVDKMGQPVILAESLSQVDGVLRWRSQISSYDIHGRATAAAQLDARDGSLPNGDYVVLNDNDEIGVLRLNGAQLDVSWRPLTFAGSTGVDTSDSRAAFSAQDAEAAAPVFDFDRFAQISADIDGDQGRSSDRPIARAQILANAQLYLQQKWAMSAANYSQDGLMSKCSPPQGQLWERPQRLENSVGHSIEALPYKWGGYISVDRFMTLLSQRQLAGSVCACSDPERNYCVVANAAGIDCSGFLSRAWGVDRYTTVSLPHISNSVSWRDLKPGDALNKPGKHVRLFLDLVRGTDIGFRIEESSVTCGGVCDRVLDAHELDGYQPRRFKYVRD